jgi:hypothetical protein
VTGSSPENPASGERNYQNFEFKSNLTLNKNLTIVLQRNFLSCVITYLVRRKTNLRGEGARKEISTTGRHVMKSFVKNTVVGLAMVALVAIGAFAAGKDKVKKETVTLLSDVTVNGTLVKAGTYEIKFDEKTGELAILKDGKVKAKANMRSEERSDKAQITAVRTANNGSIAELIGVTFAGSTQNLVLSGNSGAVTGNQH